MVFFRIKATLNLYKYHFMYIPFLQIPLLGIRQGLLSDHLCTAYPDFSTLLRNYFWEPSVQNVWTVSRMVVSQHGYRLCTFCMSATLWYREKISGWDSSQCSARSPPIDSDNHCIPNSLLQAFWGCYAAPIEG